jgi:hypothetical protein
VDTSRDSHKSAPTATGLRRINQLLDSVLDAARQPYVPVTITPRGIAGMHMIAKSAGDEERLERVLAIFDQFADEIDELLRA